MTFEDTRSQKLTFHQRDNILKWNLVGQSAVVGNNGLWFMQQTESDQIIDNMNQVIHPKDNTPN